ncbi:terminase small subunit [Arthrobacter phage Emotion]|uniref:Terminase small subunit n=1 Tax=Arthrobacter phage Emotion TaxID=3038361 RepID=A0AA49EQX9_9CAUD|nr:terminase small subunit [Arthrobacter phage Emotion]
MAGRGPAPKQTHQRERDTKRRQSDAVHLADDGEIRGPEFPYDVVPTPQPATLEWWETWRRVPQAQLFEDTDWQVLKRAAKLQDFVLTTPRSPAQAMAELRLIEERFGATYVDRQRAKIQIQREQAEAQVVTLRPVRSERQDV